MPNNNDRPAPPPGAAASNAQPCQTCSTKNLACESDGAACFNCRLYRIPCSLSKASRKRGPPAGYFSFLENRVRILEAALHTRTQNRQAQQQQQQQQQQQHLRNGSAPLPVSPPKQSIPAVSGSGSDQPLPQLAHEQSDVSAPSRAVARSAASVWPADHYFLNIATPVRVDLISLFCDWQSPKIRLHSKASLLPIELASPVPTASAFQPADPGSQHRGTPGSGSSLPPPPAAAGERASASLSLSLLHAMYSLVLVYPPTATLESAQAAERSFAVARSLALDEMENVPERAMQVFFILSGYTAMCGRLDSLVLLTAAIRLAQKCRLHAEDADIALSPQQREMRRRLWWILFESDIQASMNTGLPFDFGLDCEMAAFPSMEIFDALNSNSNSNSNSNPASTYQQASFASGTAHAPYREDHQGSAYIPYSSPISSSNHTIPTSSQPLPLVAAPVAEPFYNYFGPLLVIIKRIVVFLRLEAARVQDSTAADPRLDEASRRMRHTFDQELDDWLRCQPPWMQVVCTTYCNNPLSSDPPHWSVAYVLMYFHFAYLLLHSPLLAIAVHHERQIQQQALQPHLQPHFQPVDPAAFQIALASAHRSSFSATVVSELTRRFLMHNPSFDHVRCSIISPIAASCMAHIQLMSLPWTDKHKTFDVVVGTHFRALELIAPFWVPASWELLRLRAALDEHLAQCL